MKINDFLNKLTDDLDLPKTKRDKAEQSYKAVSEHFKCNLGENAEIYTQGSFRLGTMVKPIIENEDYDLDWVCELTDSNSKNQFTPTSLKKLIGETLKKSDNYISKLKEVNRCWRLNYAGDFHVDILPAVADGGNGEILVPDKKLHDWSPSNPKGYAKWFEKRSAQVMIFAEDRGISAAPFPKDTLKNPLQRSIQILKRHRDILFQDSYDNKPISIIITTLAAHAYRGENNVYDALKGILQRMDDFIEKHGNTYWVRNPTNSEENFAEKWNENIKRKESFYSWFENAKMVFRGPAFIQDSVESKTVQFMESVFGKRLVENVLDQDRRKIQLRGIAQLDISHKKSLEDEGWELSRQLKEFKIIAQKSGERSENYRVSFNSGEVLRKQLHLKFQASIQAPKDCFVKWQVTNSGEEAKYNKCLRGEFYDSNCADDRLNSSSARSETALYTGIHFVQCFFINEHRICVARSEEFIVNIE